MAQPRKPKGSPNGTGGQFDHMNHTDMGLPALDVSNQPVGEEFMDTVNDIASNLSDHQQDWDDLPIGGCYRINDFGDYVTEDDWDEVWDGHPLEEKAWMLADNGRYTSDDVARMTPAEIEAAYDEGDIYTDTYEQHPTYAFYTEKYEDDYDLDEPIGATVADRVRHTGEQLAGQSRESMDFEPGETVHATPDGFVGEHEWEQAWGDQPLYVRAAYELSCRHPGLHMENLSPKQIITMNNSEQAYEQYVWGTGRSNETDTDLDHDTRLNMDMYRQNERNAQYAGRDLNNVICMREAAYTGNDGTLTTQVRQSTLRVLDAPDPTGDMDSLSTIALGLNHDPVHTVEMLTGQMNTKAASEGVGLQQTLVQQLAAHPDASAQRNARALSTVLTCVESNADDMQGAAWLSASVRLYADCVGGVGDRAETRRWAQQIATMPGGGQPLATARTVASAIVLHIDGAMGAE